MEEKRARELYHEYFSALLDYLLEPVEEVDYSKNFPKVINGHATFTCGKNIVPNIVNFDGYLDFDENCAIVFKEFKNGMRYNYIDREGNFLSEDWLESATIFDNHYSIANDRHIFDARYNFFHKVYENGIKYIGGKFFECDDSFWADHDALELYDAERQVRFHIEPKQKYTTPCIHDRVVAGSLNTSKYVKVSRHTYRDKNAYSYNFIDEDGVLLRKNWFKGKGYDDDLPFLGLRKIDENKYLGDNAKTYKGDHYPIEKYRYIDGYHVERTLNGKYKCTSNNDSFVISKCPIKIYRNYVICTDDARKESFFEEIWHSVDDCFLYSRKIDMYSPLSDYGHFFSYSANGIDLDVYPEQEMPFNKMFIYKDCLFYGKYFDSQKFYNDKMRKSSEILVYDEFSFMLLSDSEKEQLVEKAKSLVTPKVEPEEKEITLQLEISIPKKQEDNPKDKEDNEALDKYVRDSFSSDNSSEDNSYSALKEKIREEVIKELRNEIRKDLLKELLSSLSSINGDTSSNNSDGAKESVKKLEFENK